MGWTVTILSVKGCFIIWHFGEVLNDGVILPLIERKCQSLCGFARRFGTAAWNCAAMYIRRAWFGLSICIDTTELLDVGTAMSYAVLCVPIGIRHAYRLISTKTVD